MNSRLLKKMAENPLARRKPYRSFLLFGILLLFLIGISSKTFQRRVFASGTITGIVYLDYNANGIRDISGVSPNFAVDTGVQNVTVSAYDSSGVFRGSTTTGATGTYSLGATGAGPYRIEFTNLPAGYTPGPHGTNNNSAVQFIPDGNSSNIDLGITNANFYLQNDPEMITSCYVFGAQNAAAVANDPVLVTFPYSAGTTDISTTALPAFPTQYDNPASHAMMLSAQNVGTTFGIAYARTSRRIYAAAFFKRHAGFGPGADGIFNNTDDAGAVYRVERATGTVSATYTIPGATTNAHNTGNYNTDNNNTGWDGVGKTSLGSVEISPDETTLYVMNLQNRTLYALNASTGAVITSQAVPTTGVPTPGGTATNAAAGDVRPFAVRYYQGSLYVGIITSGESTGSRNDIFAQVYSVNPATLAFSASPVFTARLNYPRGKANAAAGAVAEWNPWKPTFTNLITDGSALTRVVYAQPMLTDLVFDNGNLILGIRDRLGDQVGNNTQSNPASTELFQPRICGDILRGCGNPTSGWTLESNGRCGGQGTAPQNTGQGPGSGTNTPPGSGTTGYGEYYFGDAYTLDDGTTVGAGSNHDEVSLGTMAQIPGAANVLLAVFDPIPNILNETHDGGFRWFNNSTGAFTRSYRLYAGSTDAGVDDFFGKAAGLGEVEFVADPAPIEIGNRLWTDTNGNGIQDPGETAVTGATVQLWADTNADGTVDTQVGTATTDASGNYYFGGSANTNMLANASCSNSATFRLTQGTDDAEQTGTTVTLNGSPIGLARPAGVDNIVGLHFPYVTIPKGANITSATLQFTGSATPNTGSTPVNVTIRGEASDNAATFAATASNISGRAATTASVNWTNIGTWTAGATTNAISPDVKTIVQEVINRSGWGSSNSLAFVITNNGTTGTRSRNAQDFETSTAQAAVLSVQYQCSYKVAASTKYEIRVATGQAALTATPALTTTNADAGTNGDSHDSDATLSGSNAVITITTGSAGANDHTLDMGFLPTASAVYSIGNRVFFDTNNNGVMDAAEVGAGNVTVQLLNTSNTVLQTQTTTTTSGSAGYYRFDNLVAGTYKIRIPSSNFTTGGALVGYQNSSNATISTDKNDNGVDPASSNPSTAGVLSADIVVGTGALPASEPDVTGSGAGAHAAIGDARDNLTVDFGFYSLVLGNLIFLDATGNGTFDGIDTPLSGAIVKLYQSNGTTEVAVGPDGILGTADDTTGATNQLTTASNGLYQFSGLTPGSYVVKVTPGSGYKSAADVTNTSNPNSNTDNDDNGVGVGTGQISSVANASAIALTPGSEPTLDNNTGKTTNSTLDFGVNSVTAVKFTDCQVTGYDKGALLEWQTSYEIDNLGFNIYKEDNGKRALINQKMIAGSAVKVGADTLISSGFSYAWWDSSAPSKTAAYWLEGVDLSGTSQWFGPFFAKQVGGAAPTRNNAAVLSNLGAPQEQITRPVEAMARMPKSSAKLVDKQPYLTISRTAVKIGVKEEGWYRIPLADLQRAGLPAGTNLQFLQMYVDGEEMPIIINNDAAGGAVEFYGICVNSRYTMMRTYYLVPGLRQGLRVSPVEGKGSQGNANGFTYSVEHRDRTIYFSALKNGEAENFFGAVLAGSPLNQNLDVKQIDRAATGEALLDVSIQGLTLINHSIFVQLNGASLGYVNFAGQALGAMQFRLPHSMLVEGTNRVTLTPMGGPADVDLVDFIRLTYQHSYRVENDALKFTATGGRQIDLDGFTNKAIRVLDVTNSSAISEMKIDVQESLRDGYRVSFASSETGERTFLAFTEEKKKTPPMIKADDLTTWKQTSNAADFVILTTKEFAPAFDGLKALRQSQGLVVAVVYIEDIYDEFSYGQKNVQAIKDFLSFTSKWSKAPRYVMFGGDASYDPKNYLGAGDFDFVPSKLVDTDYMETVSDEWLADFDGDGVEDLNIGRLPVRTVDQAKLMAAKITAYEKAIPSQEVLLVADTPDIYDFETATDTLRAMIESQVQVGQIKRGRLNPAVAKQQLLDAFNRGQKVVNYVGHGTVDMWRGSLLTNADVDGLSNEKLSFVVIMSCLNGYYHDPFQDGMAERLMKAERGGGVAVWASSSLTEPHEQALLNQELYRQLFNAPIKGSKPTISEAIRKAKSAIFDMDIRRTWVFFGDPTTKLR
jgi:hypothetical protein